MFPGLGSFYQLGFVARDLDMAIDALGRRFGIMQFRRRRSSEWLETAHAWANGVMIEVMMLGAGAPAIYAGYTPAEDEAIRLHHHGYRVADEFAWEETERLAATAGLTIPIKGTAMGGDLYFMYADTRSELGVFTEFVMLKGIASTLYDDVPQN